MGIEPTSVADLDRAVSELAEHRDAFARTGVRERLALLGQLARDTHAVAQAQVRAACRAKRIPLESPTAAEEWLGGPMTTLRNIRLLRQTLEQIEQHGHPVIPDKTVRERGDGQVVVQVLPHDGWDKVLFGGFEAEIWMEPEVRRSELMETVAVAYRPGAQTPGRTALVLGAGNVASIGPMDVLYKMFVENQVCVLKMNPVNEYLGPFIEQGFKAAIDAGYLRVVYGDASEGEHLVQHELVDEIHITGSDRVHDIIVWGTGAEAERRRAAGEPRMSKRITSELGCVTPVIVTPGEWTKAELDFQAQNVATMIANNASFNCNAAKVLVTSSHWPQRGAFLARLRDVLAELAPRQAYYPGAEERFTQFGSAYPQLERIGQPSAGALPWGLATGLDAASDEMAFTREAWCSFIGEVSLDARDAESFLDAAVTFCNERLWGTLSCMLLIDPRTAKSAGSRQAYERAVADLRYGTVAINHWAGMGYGNCLTTWGAYPGHTLENIGSGIGVVHNTLMFERPQKSVLRGPFVVRPKPPWFATHRRAQHAARRLTDFEARPGVPALLQVVAQAVRG